MTTQLSAEVRVAAFIDVDNLVICAQNSGLPFNLKLILQRVRQEGLLMSARAYADWTSNTLRPFIADFRSLAVELIELSTMISASEHKNTADMQLAVDALEMALSPYKPVVIVIVGGDRDYVPLVQKLKRYGVRVVGIGVRVGVSRILAQACDSFVFYDDLLPPDEEDLAPPAEPDQSSAFTLMRTAIDALDSSGKPATGAAVKQMMQQLDPTFDLARYKSLKELATEAQRLGFVKVHAQPGTDMLLSAGVQRPVSKGRTRTERDYDFSSAGAAAASYRAILQEARIPLLSRAVRNRLIEMLEAEIAASDDRALSMDQMRDLATQDGHAFLAVQKFLYTMNLGECFLPSGERRPRTLGIPGETHIPVSLVGAVSSIEPAIHQRYIRVLDKKARLNPDGVYELLYDDSLPVNESEREEILNLVTEWCDQMQPPPLLCWRCATQVAGRVCSRLRVNRRAGHRVVVDVAQRGEPPRPPNDPYRAAASQWRS